MTASDPIKITPQDVLGRQAVLALQHAFIPWAVDEIHHDYGRDLLIQLVDEGPLTSRLSPMVCLAQCKGHAHAFEEVEHQVVETRHLANWSDRSAVPTLIAIWSRSSKAIRIRLAKTVAAQLDNQRPQWRDQETIRVPFTLNDGFDGTPTSRMRLVREIKHEQDALGGQTRFHSAKRICVLTYLFLGTVNTSHTVTMEGPEQKVELTHGPGWLPNDLDVRDVHADFLLASSLLLFETIWVPLPWCPVAAVALGSDSFLELVHSGRLIPFALTDLVGVARIQDRVEAELITFRGEPELSMHIRVLLDTANRCKEPQVAAALLKSSVRYLPSQVSSLIVADTRADLQRANIRSLLGLRPHIAVTEPYWDALLINRLLAVNEARAVAAAASGDVIMYEGGLSRLAWEKDYSALSFNRQFPSSALFDEVLRAIGLPDLGQVARYIRLPEIASLSSAPQAQEFRDWFWDVAASIVGEGHDIRVSFEKRLSTALSRDAHVMALPTHLKLRFFEVSGASTTGASGSQSIGYGFRADNGSKLIAQQARNHAVRRKAIISALLNGRVFPYDPCPCLSGAAVRFCCGRRVT